MSDLSYTQLNVAKSTSFIFTITNRKALSLRIQNATVGSVNLGATPFPTRSADILIPSNKIDFGPMNLQFLVSENLTEWFDIYKWMVDITKNVESHTEFTEVGELTILDSQNREIMRVIYHGIFPLTLGELMYSVVDDEVSLVADLTVQFDKFDLINLLTGEEIIYE